MFQKLREEKVGTICKDYVNLKEISRFTELVGKGGFGKVYQYEQPATGRQLAIKVEEKVAKYVYVICNLEFLVDLYCEPWYVIG